MSLKKEKCPECEFELNAGGVHTPGTQPEVGNFKGDSVPGYTEANLIALREINQKVFPSTWAILKKK